MKESVFKETTATTNAIVINPLPPSTGNKASIRTTVTNLALQILRKLIPPIQLPFLDIYFTRYCDLPEQSQIPENDASELFLMSLFPELELLTSMEKETVGTINESFDFKLPYGSPILNDIGNHEFDQPIMDLQNLNNFGNSTPFQVHSKKIPVGQLKKSSLDTILTVFDESQLAGEIVYHSLLNDESKQPYERINQLFTIILIFQTIISNRYSVQLKF